MTNSSRLIATSAAALVAAMFATAPAAAQNFSAEPTYETVALEAGFPEDPHIVQLQSGGDIDASHLGGGCVGFIADAPDVRLNYTAGNFPLSITSIADTDTTLVINGPDGQWYCDDDGAEQGSHDALVAFNSPQSGQYDIWVGTYSEAALNDATLFITERVLNEQ